MTRTVTGRLAVFLPMVCLLFMAQFSKPQAGRSKLPSAPELLGSWELIAYKSPKDSVFSYLKAPDRALKTLTPKHFSFAYFNSQHKKFDMAGGGTYTYRNGTYSEQVAYFSLDSALVGRTLVFSLSLKADTLYQLRVLKNRTRMEEYWKKVKE